MLAPVPKRNSWPQWLMLVFLLAVVACSDKPGELSEAQRGQLLERVNGRWQALIDHDYAKAWEYGTPAFRAVFPQNLYVQRFSHTLDRELTGVEILHYDSQAAVATVAVRLLTKPARKGDTTAIGDAAVAPASVVESWILIDGKWWFSVTI